MSSPAFSCVNFDDDDFQRFLNDQDMPDLDADLLAALTDSNASAVAPFPRRRRPTTHRTPTISLSSTTVT